MNVRIVEAGDDRAASHVDDLSVSGTMRLHIPFCTHGDQLAVLDSDRRGKGALVVLGGNACVEKHQVCSARIRWLLTSGCFHGSVSHAWRAGSPAYFLAR
jgi:hypothetical protein